jgi:hypothetical protein
MKTTFNLLVAVCIALFISCETDIPEIDTTPPEFSFQITGDGFDRTFTQDDDFSSIQLNLKEGTSYNVLISGIDNGGVRRIQWELPLEYLDLQTPVNTPWQENTSGFTTTISWNGDPSNPLTASLYSGTFIASGDQVSIATYLRVEDFGGESGPPFNVTDASLNILIAAEQTTEVISI